MQLLLEPAPAPTLPDQRNGTASPAVDEPRTPTPQDLGRGDREHDQRNEVRAAGEAVGALNDSSVELAVSLHMAVASRRQPEPAAAVPPCRDSTGWDYVEGDFDQLVRAVDGCRNCPLFAACEQALDDWYPKWGDQRRGTGNPRGVVWAGRAFDDDGRLQTPHRMVKKAAQQARAVAQQQHRSAAA